MSTLQLILVIYEQENREMPIFSLGLCNFPRIISILLSKNEENHAIAFALGKVYFAIKVFNFPLLFQKVEKWPKNVWKRSKISKQLLARKFKVKTFLKSLNCRIFKNCNFWRENSKSLLDYFFLWIHYFWGQNSKWHFSQLYIAEFSKMWFLARKFKVENRQKLRFLAMRLTFSSGKLCINVI